MDSKRSPELEDVVRERVAARDEALRAAIQLGLDDIKAGRYTVIYNEEELMAFFDNL